MIALALAGAGSSAFGQQANGASEAAKPSSPAIETKPPVVLSNRSVSTLNVDYVGKGDPLQSLDIYAPKGVTGASVYVFVHGGGWNKRDKDEVGSQPKLLNDAGIVAVSLNYRLVPAIQHPENVRDVAAAIAWLTKNIAKFGGDPKKMVLMGHSAGSHLVALVATDDRYLAAHGLHRNALAGVICLDGSAFDIPDRIKNGAPTVAENCRRAFGDNPTMQVDGSPVTHVKGKVPLPPFFLVFLNEDIGKSKKKPPLPSVLSKSSAINRLSAARFFLFGSRDVWFVVALPVFLSDELGWSHSGVGGFLAAWVIGYGIVQSIAPRLLARGGRQVDEVKAAQRWAFILTVLSAVIAVLVAADVAVTTVIVGGLVVFGVVFAMNSSLHSFLVLAFSDDDKVALDVGFYYSANAAGRFVGTFLSGVLYLWGDLPGALWGSAGFVLLTWLLTLRLPALPEIGRAHV